MFTQKKYFALSLSNGVLQVIDLPGFNKEFTVPAVKDTSKRFVINLTNVLKNEQEGDFFIVTDGSYLNVNMWCKPNQKKQFKQRIDGNKKFQDEFNQNRGGGFRGGYRGGSNYRGGKQGGHFKRGGY
jgi:hypothetical protein